MNIQRTLVTIGLVLVFLLVGGPIFWSSGTHSLATGLSPMQTGSVPLSKESTAPLTTNQPPSTCAHCTHNLVGKTADELGQFAQSYAKEQLKATSVPQVLLTRLVDAQTLADLGLGCGVAFSAIEQPPLILVILKGDFDFRDAAPGFSQLPAPIAGKDAYVVYVFDAWAGTPEVILPSYDGALVKKALQDRTLPDNTEMMPSVCATPIPASQKQLHYGAEAPGFTVPTHATFEVTPPPYDTPAPPSTAVPVGTYIPVTPTPGAPPPLPTTNP